jgi:1,2-phenylacetyl-CoA epoxidase catalytic subunit
VAEAKAAIAYWRPRVAASFGLAGSERHDRLARLGLRHATNEALLARWETLVSETLGPIGLN